MAINYKVVEPFADMEGNRHIYAVGDTFPADGVDVDEKRIYALSTQFNLLGKPVIAPMDEKPIEKRTRKKKSEE